MKSTLQWLYFGKLLIKLHLEIIIWLLIGVSLNFDRNQFKILFLYFLKKDILCKQNSAGSVNLFIIWIIFQYCFTKNF